MKVWQKMLLVPAAAVTLNAVIPSNYNGAKKLKIEQKERN